MFSTLLSTVSEQIWTEHETFNQAINALNKAVISADSVKEAYIYKHRDPNKFDSGIMVASLRIIR